MRKNIRLVTIQPYDVYQKILAEGRYVCDYSLTNNYDCGYDHFKEPYKWLCRKMVDRIGAPPEGVEFPVWAWYRYGDNEDFSDWNSDGRKYVKITIKIDSSRVVLTDFNDWHCVLNNCPLIPESVPEEEFDAEWERYDAAGPKAIEATWERIFRDDGSYVQATFWELRLADIVEAEEFISQRNDFNNGSNESA